MEIVITITEKNQKDIWMSIQAMTQDGWKPTAAAWEFEGWWYCAMKKTIAH